MPRAYPLLTRFTPYDLLATLLWALHGCLIGYVGGRAFGDNHLAGILTGMGLAMAAAALLENGRWSLWARGRDGILQDGAGGAASTHDNDAASTRTVRDVASAQAVVSRSPRR